VDSLLHNPLQFFWIIVFPIVIYTLHGWLATKMAIVMLFRPYEPWVIFGRPMIQGILPRRRHKLSQAVASTVTETLLTTSDIKMQAERLVTEENIYLAVDEIVTAVLHEFRDTAKLHRLANELSELAPPFMEQLVLAVIEGVEHGRHRNIATITERIFDQIILSVRISRHQADEASKWIMDSIVTSSNIRHELVRLLSPQNIVALEESIGNHASGPYKLLARIIGVKRVCYEWRNFLEKEPEQAEKIIRDLVKHFNIEEQVATRIANFDLRSLPLQTISQIRLQSISLVEEFLVTHKEAILASTKNIQGPAISTVQSAIIRFNPESLRPEWLERAKKGITAFCYAYLNTALGTWLERAIPALGVYNIIARKIELFTPQQLEEVVLRICKQELHWLEVLGSIIGLWLGLLQVAINIANLNVH
jgi:uncharacterized membrane protein YheB (UPF0754 family)